MNSTKNKWKKVLPYFLLGGLTLFFCWLFCLQRSVFGSNLDWISQHSVFPDYFRQHFYQTKQFFPEFAPNIGGGQNIYNFSYYGLYNPIILLSYALPFVKMSYYIMVTSLIALVSSVLLVYYWLRTRNFKRGTCFALALLFALATPMIFHSYTQIMFVDYMPFLCMGLIGADRYFEKKKSGLLAISVCMMVLTSYYFSIGGLLVLGIYGIYHCMVKVEDGILSSVSDFFKSLIQFILPMFIGVLMSGILLVPTAMTLLGRGGDYEYFSKKALFFPEISFLQMTYSAYGIGLTVLAVIVVITGLFSKKWSVRLLHLGTLIILTIPVFSLLLNGGLYIRHKVMIPFLPIFCLMIALYLEYLEKKQNTSWKELIPYSFVLILFFFDSQAWNSDYQLRIILDFIVLLIAYIIYIQKHKTWPLLIFSLVLLLLSNIDYHEVAENKLDYETYTAYTNVNIGNAISEVTNEENGFYRLEQQGDVLADTANLNRIWNMNQHIASFYSSLFNEEYMDFRQYTFHLNQPFRNHLMQVESYNPIFQKVMGIKYIASHTEVSGYTPYQEQYAEATIWKREGTAPVIYGTSKTIEKDAYKELSFPYTQLVFADYAVVDSNKPTESQTYESNVRNGKFNIPTRIFDVKTNAVKVPISPQENENLLFIKFRVRNNIYSDVVIRVDGIQNRLSSESYRYYNGNEDFVYVLNVEQGQKEVLVEMGAGDYELTDIECYYADCDLVDTSLYESEFVLDKQASKDNLICGSIDQKSDGWLITSIPYDKNFVITIDGKEAEIDKVNTAFLGCEIPKGKHVIEIRYHAPGVVLGKAISLIGIGAFALMIIIPLRKKKEKLY